MVIATREIRERSRLLIVAAALAILPFAVALAPGAQGNRGHAIMVVGAAGAFNFAIAIALAMGISTICRDLSEKRLSFYFSKPVSPFSLWFGKSIASLLIALLAAVIIAVPSYLGARDAWRQAWNTGGDRLALAFPILLLLFFFGSHAIATMMRSRSVLVALDFILLVAAVAVMAAILRPVLLAGGMRMTGGIGSAVAGGILIILAIAPVWQLAKGRTDIRRSHLEFSK
ncbi:MAG TPA: hypothetical protein VJZ00_22970, partial [Thermoanaerobaculia bacterium]|nr:hypothetical protein [Thermoanaerobaculia bacterium]